jgi:hypothetical protein
LRNASKEGSYPYIENAATSLVLSSAGGAAAAGAAGAGTAAVDAGEAGSAGAGEMLFFGTATDVSTDDFTHANGGDMIYAVDTR